MNLKLLMALILGVSMVNQGLSQSSSLYQIGKVDSLYSDVLDEQRTFWVELPEQYNPNSDHKYPVVFVLDGSVQMRALSTVYNYYWGHFLPNMILVGISNQNHRTVDLTPSELKTSQGNRYATESGGADKFSKFIEKELIPYIDKNYPTTSYRTLIGHSYAGLFTVNMLINYPEAFTNYLAIDPSLDWDNKKLINAKKQDLLSNRYKGKSLFLSLGGEQLHMLDESVTINNVKEDTSSYTLFARSILEFAEYLENASDKELNFSWKYYPNDLHGTVVLPTITDGLLWLFDWYKLETPSKFNNLDTPVKELVDILNYRSSKLTSHFGYKIPPMGEEQINMMGYMALQSGQMEKSKAFFEMNMKYYPESANTYDSMGDYYEANGDVKQAIHYVEKAFKLSGNTYHKNRIEDLKSNLK